LTQDERRRVLKRSSIYIEDGVIAGVGKVECEAETVIDGAGKMALPAFINAHTHAAMTLLRGYADDLPLKQWLEQKIWPLERKLTEYHCYWGALLACIEMAKAGCSCFLDMYFYPEATAEAAVKVGLKAVISYGMFDFNDPSLTEQQLEGARRFLGKASELRMKGVEPALGPHAPYTCSDRLLMEAAELARRNRVLLHIHLAETVEEVDEFKRRYGRTEIEHLDRLGVLGPDVVAAHCVHLSRRDVRLLARRGVKVVHCPVSNLKLGSGIAPVTELLKAKVTVALGTDGAASNNSLSMLGAIKLAALLQKALYRDPSAISAQQVLDMATLGGALSLNLRSGKLAEGYRGDVVLLDLNRPSYTPLFSPTSHVVYASEGTEAYTLVVDGRVIVSRGKVVSIDERSVIREASRAARDLVARR